MCSADVYCVVLCRAVLWCGGSCCIVSVWCVVM